MPTVGTTSGRRQLTSDALRVCCTSYRESYRGGVRDANRVNVTSYLRHPSESGFTANHRPAIYYSPSLDHTDNPLFGLLLSDSFVSQTKRHYQPHIRSNSLSSLPTLVNKNRDSGFHQLKLHQKTVSGHEETEYKRVFVPHRVTPSVFRRHVTIGPKRETGFTEVKDLHLLTFQEKTRTRTEPRRTPCSVMKTDFLPASCLQGNEAIPGLTSRSCRETGFTRGAITPPVCPTVFTQPSQTKKDVPTEKTVGKKEPSGFLLNAPSNQVFPDTPCDCSHFTTHYKSNFCRTADSGRWRSGHAGARIISGTMDDGYSRRDLDRFILRG